MSKHQSLTPQQQALRAAAEAAERAREEEAKASQGQDPKVQDPAQEPAKPKAPEPANESAKPKTILLRAKKYDLVDPTSGVRVPSGQLTQVQSISPWLRSQISAGLVEEVNL